MGQLVKLLAPAGVGLAMAALLGAHNLEDSHVYMLVTSVLLAIGLYGSTFQIDLRQAREHRRLILLAVTVGVIVKAALIGVILTLAFHDPLFLLLGVVVAQIDPLAVAAVMDQPRLSDRAKTILASWSSFDDPVTVILGIYVATLVGQLTGSGGAGLAGSDAVSWLWQVGANAIFVLVAYAVWRAVRRWPAAVLFLLIVLVAVAVWQFTMLGLAITGLFVRPAIGRQLSWAIWGALVAAAFLAGMLLLDGVRLGAGASLGVAAFAAQVVVGYLLTRGLLGTDRVRLAFAQQNGITAIILALLFETQFPGVVAVVAPAIFVVNALHLIANSIIDRRDARALPSAVATTPP